MVQLESFTDASNQNNLIVFELPSDQSLDTVLSFIQIKQMRTLNNGNQELTVTVNSGDTDKTLLALLQHEATIKQLMPLNSKKEQFHSHF